VFNLSGSEVIIILILALVILGPDKLPDAMRRAGRTWAELRKLSDGFQAEVRKGFEEPTKEVKQAADAVRKAAAFPSKKLHYNPLKDAPPKLPEGESVADPDPGEVAAPPPEASAAAATPPAEQPDEGEADRTAAAPDGSAATS
jgi:sec-independent protein translocase protein TatB